MKTTVILWHLVWGSLAALATACGGDDGGNPAQESPTSGTVKSGVAPEKSVNSLSAAEAQSVSASFAQAIQGSGLIDGVCTLTGILGEAFSGTTGEAKTCEQLVTECKAAPTQTTESTLSIKDDPAQLSGCTVTVGELETCLNGMITSLKQAFSTVTCDTELQAAMQSFSTGMNITACTNINTTCPTLLAAMDDTQTTP